MSCGRFGGRRSEFAKAVQTRARRLTSGCTSRAASRRAGEPHGVSQRVIPKEVSILPMRLRPVVSTILVVSVTFPAMVRAQSETRFVDPLDLFALSTVLDARISPDGSRVAYAVQSPLSEGGPDARRTRVHVVSLAGEIERVIESEDHELRHPRWSPDGRYLAYLSSEEGGSQVWLTSSDGGPARRVTDAPSPARTFAWSPDGTRIAYVAADPADPAVIERQKLVELSTDVAPADRLWIAWVDSGEAEPVTSPPLNVLGTPDWSPDGSAIAFNHAPSTDFQGVKETEVSVIDLGTRARSSIRLVGTSFATPRFSPDGAWVAVRSDVAPADGPARRAVYVVSADGAKERWISEADQFTEIAGWTGDGMGIVVVSQVRTLRRVLRHPIDGGPLDVLYDGPLLVAGLDTRPSDRMVAFVGQSLTRPPEVYVSSLSDFVPTAVSSVNAGLESHQVGETELVRWTSSDGEVIEGLLTYPMDYDTGNPAPLLVVAHAGGETFTQEFVANPFTGSSRAFPPPVFSSRGYAILRVNQRGGGLGGYGFDYALPSFRPEMRANDDILAGVDRLVSEGIADAERMAIMGWSNGGLVTASLITNTDRFAAASMMAGFPYLTLQSGTNPWVSLDLGAEPWEDPTPYLEHAPEFALDRVQTPTLIIQGESDSRFVAQARALHGSLTRLGVMTELAVYAGMGHAPSRPSQMVDIAERNLRWFDRHLRGR